jgi:16S rRNA (adenine1518-N6/adenine1519-N6)-dimethyltransferase
VERCLSVPAAAFHPAPKVASAAVRLTPLDIPRASMADDPRFPRAVRAAFAQRRKTVANSLRGAGIADAAAALACAELEPTRRAETFSVEEFDRLAACLALG